MRWSRCTKGRLRRTLKLGGHGNVSGLPIGSAQWGPDKPSDIYPCVGLHLVGERIRVNLGKEKFVFDICGYVRSQCPSDAECKTM